MAILKHIPVRNSDYGDAQRYLLFEHDEVTGKPILDEKGNMMLRKGYIQSGHNCDPFSFNTECTELNRSMGKNGGKNDVKAHHYIMSFDPRDAEECGLTPGKVHAIAEEFAKHFFAGHQVLLVTHPDGHNGSGNIHTHIVLNSLRKENVPYQTFMERPIDCLAGYKHHQTRDLLTEMFYYMNGLCEREHLHTVDFSVPTDRKVTDREYQAAQKGQRELDELNAEITADGFTPSRTDYQTVKDEIRSAVDAVIETANTEEEFRRRLEEQYRITVKETRGVWSYIHPDRKQPIRGRSLGRIYEKEAVRRRLFGIDDIDRSRPEYETLPKVFVIRSDLRLVTDIQNCVKAQQSRAYARRVEISNLQQKAKAVAYLQTHKIGSLEELQRQVDEAEQQYRDARNAAYEDTEQLKTVNEEIHYLGQYYANKKTYAEFLNSPNKGEYRQAHQSEIDTYEQATAVLRSHYPDGRFPTMNELKSKKSALQKDQRHQTSQQNTLYNRMKELRIVNTNIHALLAPQTPVIVKRREESL